MSNEFTCRGPSGEPHLTTVMEYVRNVRASSEDGYEVHSVVYRCGECGLVVAEPERWKKLVSESKR